MTPDQVAAFVAERGTACTLQRAGEVDLPVRAFVRGYAPAELVGGLQQGDREVTLGNRETAAAGWTPRKGDRFLIGSQMTIVQVCESRSVGDQVFLYILTVRGS